MPADKCLQARRRVDVRYRREVIGIEHLAKLVVKTTGDSGGYNMLMGPFAARDEIKNLKL